MGITKQKEIEQIQDLLVGNENALDEVVHEIYAAKASDINNSGIFWQVEHLVQEGAFKDVSELIDYIKDLIK